jgi:hypothetical protein
MRHLLVAAMLCLAALPAWAADPPRYVAGPASGYRYECEQAGQPVPRLAALVSEVADLDGDGTPDHVIDAAKGCAAVRALYCNDTEGCTIRVFLSRWSGIAEGFKARSWTVNRATRPPTLSLVTGGRECGDAPTCTLVLRWTGERLQPVR